jgi:hypothetical protein
MTETTEALQERIARAICLSKQRHGDTDAVATQYVDTFWRDYLPEVAHRCVRSGGQQIRPRGCHLKWLCTSGGGAVNG